MKGTPDKRAFGMISPSSVALDARCRVAVLDNSNTFQSKVRFMNYNVKIIEYLDSYQVRTYRRPITVNNKVIASSQKKETFEHHERTQKQIIHSEKSSVNRSVNQIYSIARSNRWEYFVTLTIDPIKLDSTNFKLIIEKLIIWTNNLKKRYAPDLKYVIVPELHKDKLKWHFHGLFANVGNIPFKFSGKTCVGKFVYDYARKPYATKIYNLPLWRYGFSTATKVRDSAKASSYITKYITKDLATILQNKHRFFASQNINHPKERVYNIDYDVLSEIYKNYFSDISYMSNVRVPSASQEICYMEFNKNHASSGSSADVDFNIFESAKKKECNNVSFDYREISLEKYKDSEKRLSAMKASFSQKHYTINQYIFELQKLKRQIKENPDLKKLYSDLCIDDMLMRAKYEKTKRGINNEQIGFSMDGFYPAFDTPFL